MPVPRPSSFLCTVTVEELLPGIELPSATAGPSMPVRLPKSPRRLPLRRLRLFSLPVPPRFCDGSM